MFSKIIKYYNQNKSAIWRIVAIIIFILLIIYTANYLVREKNKGNNIKESTATNSKTQSLKQPIISGSDVAPKITENNINAIEEFINHCNENQIEEAYNMLSEDCKNNSYKSIEDFKNDYYNKIFTTKKEYLMENWISVSGKTTYKITYNNNALESGKINKEDINEDYITILIEDGKTKLNINSFIGSKEINKTYEDEYLKIEVKAKRTFINHEYYKIGFTNKTNNEIKLYDNNNESKWYIQDDDENKYYVNINEISQYFHSIKENSTQEIEIKYLKTYNPKKVIKIIGFDNIIISENNQIINKNISVKI